ncbi:MAG TPA: hypothetical protein VGD64_09280 [Acidisarcina sp.]
MFPRFRISSQVDFSDYASSADSAATIKCASTYFANSVLKALLTVPATLFMLGWTILLGGSPVHAQTLPLQLALNPGISGISTLPILQNTYVHAQTTPPASTTIDVGSTVKMTHVRRLGINLSAQNFYSSLLLQRNIMFRNPGFEGLMWQSIVKCATVTATTCTGTNTFNHWPADFVAGATAEFILGGALGDKVAVTGNTPASSTAGIGPTIIFATPPAGITAGDYIVVRMQTPGNAQAGWWTGVSGGASLSTELTDLSPLSPGKQALRMTAAGVGQSASVSSYADSLANYSFVQMHGGYTISFRAKGTGGANSVYINLSRLCPNAPSVRFFNRLVPLTTSWQDYSFAFQANDTGNVGTIALTFQANASSLLLDDVALTADAGPNNPTVYRDEVVAALQALHPSVLRFMDSGTSFGSTLDNMLIPSFGRMRAGYSSGTIVEDDISMGLHDYLVLCQAIGAEPWYSIPPGWSTQEMSELIDYFAGSASTVYGAKRAALGQAQPWTTVFPVIHLEFGNEAWNWGFGGANYITPADYGVRSGMMFTAAHATPSFSAKSFDLIADGFAISSNWNKTVLATSSNYNTIDIAPYLFNTFNDESSTENIFGPMFAQPESDDSTPTGVIAQQAIVAASAARPAALAVYEVNLSPLSGTASQAALDSTVPSIGGGLVAIEHMLLMMRDMGVNNQAMFAIGGIATRFQGSGPTAGTHAALWGSVVDMGGISNRRRPLYLAQQLANAAILPTMLTATQSGANPTWDQPKSTNDNISMIGAHYIQSFAFTDGTTTNLVLFNLHRTLALPVILSGANAPIGNASITTLTSAAITDNNEFADDVEPTTTSQALQSGSTLSLPPYSMTTISYAANTQTAVTSVAASCVASVLSPGGSTTCSGVVSGTGAFKTGIAWKASQGSISTAGVYTAPSSLPANTNVTITATAAGDTTKTTTALITLAAAAINSVTIVCPSDGVMAGGKLACSASVVGVGSFSSSVSWSASAGTVDANGNLIAPATGTSLILTATSKQNTAKKGTKTITIVTFPVLSALTTVPGSTTATISWTSNMQTTNGVNYGTTSSYGSTVTAAGQGTSASVTLTKLTSKTLYYIMVFSTNPTTGKTGSATATFTTH